MAIVINTRNSSVPDYIYEGILGIGAEFAGHWRASVVASFHSLSWQLRLESPGGGFLVRDLQPTGDSYLDSAQCHVALIDMRDLFAAGI